MLHLALIAALTVIDDNAQLLPQAEKEELTKYMETVKAQQNITLGFVSTQSLNGQEPRAFAVQYGETHNLGKHGIVILISMNPRKIWVQPGADFAQNLSVDSATRIAKDTMAPLAKQGKYAQAVKEGFAQTILQVSKVPEPVRVVQVAPVQPTVPKQSTPALDSNGLALLIFIIASGLFFIGFWFWKRKQDLLEKKRQEEEDEKWRRRVSTPPPPTYVPNYSRPYGTMSDTLRTEQRPEPPMGRKSHVRLVETVDPLLEDTAPHVLNQLNVTQAVVQVQQPAPPSPPPPPRTPTPPRHVERAPDPSPPRHSSSSSDSSSSWSSSDSGGGSSWDSGGGGFDGGGGGGSDF